MFLASFLSAQEYKENSNSHFAFHCVLHSQTFICHPSLSHPAMEKGSGSLLVVGRWQGVQCQSCEAGEAVLPDD